MNLKTLKTSLVRKLDSSVEETDVVTLVEKLLEKALEKDGLHISSGADRPGEYDIFGKGSDNLEKVLRDYFNEPEPGKEYEPDDDTPDEEEIYWEFMSQFGFEDLKKLRQDVKDGKAFYICKDWNDTGDLVDYTTGTLKDLITHSFSIPWDVYERLMKMGLSHEDLDFFTYNDDVWPDSVLNALPGE